MILYVFLFFFFSQITFWQILWRVYFQIVYREQSHLFLLSCFYDYSFRDLVSLVINSLNYIMQFICVVLSMINVIKFFPTKQPRYMTLQLRLNYCLSKSSCYVNIYMRGISFVLSLLVYGFCFVLTRRLNRFYETVNIAFALFCRSNCEKQF